MPNPFIPVVMPSSSSSAAVEPPRFSQGLDSACSTPFASAPSSPGNNAPSGYFFSAPASPSHILLSSGNGGATSLSYDPLFLSSDPDLFEFEFSSRISPDYSGGNGSMISADELFFNGQIRPVRLSSHLSRSEDLLPPNADPDGQRAEQAMRGRDVKIRCAKKPYHFKARSMSASPSRSAHPEWKAFETVTPIQLDRNANDSEAPSGETTPSCSASSSRSSSSGRNSKKWMFLKEFLHRSKSEGRAGNKERLWSAISFSPAKDKTPSTSSRDEAKKGKRGMKKGKDVGTGGKPVNGVWRRRAPAASAHEMHYTANRAQAEEMKRRTFLPYREGLLGCLGFSSKSYGAFSGIARNLNPISSR